MGLFRIEESKDDLLDIYLNGLTPEQRSSLMPISVPNPCNLNNTPSIQDINSDIELIHVPTPPECQPQWTSTPSTITTPPIAVGYAPQSNRIKAILPICSGGESSPWDKIFGDTKTCTTFTNDNKCITNSFWNQNYFIFSTVGCKASFEKKKCANFLGMSTCWWEKSYPENIELGVNSVKYDYEFNVPAFNQLAYNYSTTFFEFNGVKYNVNGQVIPTIPTSVGSFIFDTESDKSIMNITIMGYHISNSNFNSAIDLIAKSLVDALPPSSAAKNEIKLKMEQNKIKYNVINAVPFSNKVSFITTNINWTKNDNSIKHYFDFNFVLTYRSDYDSFGDYLSGLVGAKPYKEVEADIYGIAKYNGQLFGNRLIYK